MVPKVFFLSSWPIWTSRLWYNQLSNRSNFLSPERWKGEFSPPAKILSLSWTSSDILRDNCLVLWSWNMNFLTQWSVLSKMTSPIMQSVPNAILWVLNKNNVHKSESILQNPNHFWFRKPVCFKLNISRPFFFTSCGLYYLPRPSTSNRMTPQ